MKTKLAVLLVLLAMGGSLFAQNLILPVAGVATVDVSPAKAPYEVFVNATVTSVVFTNQTPGQLITVLFLQDSTGHGVTFGGNILNACTVSTTANALTSCQFQYDARTVQWTGLAGGGGVSSPTSLPIFFNGYTGLAPQDCSTASCNTPGVGAKGDWHSFFDCTITITTGATACTNPHFVSTDVGKTVEYASPGGTPPIVVTTITAFTDSTHVTIGATTNQTTANQAFAFGTDDTVPLRNWAAFIGNQFSSTSTTPSVRAGYLPRGQYYTTKAIRFIGPGNVAPTLANNGECTKIAGGTIWCPLLLAGDGTWASTIVGSSNFSWSADGTSANTALCYINNWSGSYIVNMGCAWAMGQESGFVLNTTGQTGLVGTWLFDNNSHTKWDSNFAYGAHNAAGTLCGLCIDKDFESEYQNSAVEFNDINLKLNVSNSNNLYEKIVFDTLFAEGGGGAQGNIQIGDNSALKQITFRNVHARDGIVSVNIRPSVTTSNGDALVFDRFRQNVTNAAGAGIGFVVQSAIRLEFNNPYFEITNSQATDTLMKVQANADISFYGGQFFASGTAPNALLLSTATPSIYAYGTKFTGGTARTSGGGNFNFFIPTTTGWTGPGGIEGTYFVSDQGTAAANGQVALSAGWGTTATVTAAAGFNQHARFTITSSGTGQAANPTITWTLPNAMPAATVLCTMEMTGGTGTNTLISQTTLSATAPVFTFNGTPVAGSTYIVDVGCGP